MDKVGTPWGNGGSAGADISSCGTYRYRLWRRWKGEVENHVTWIMLNPSTADAIKDDPTVRKCIAHARAWGFYGIDVVNLFAYRSSDPKRLLDLYDPVGPENDEAIWQSVRDAELTICAWGNNGTLGGRYHAILDMLRSAKIPFHHLGLTKSGQPKHPLSRGRNRIPVDFEPILWSGAE